MSKEILHNDWAPLLQPAFETESYKKLRVFLANEYHTQIIHPDMYDIFNALHFTPYHDVKVVILGQDPYVDYHQAHGLSFSVQKPTNPPGSLINIFKELKSDLGIEPPHHGDLTSWARQGVLLLNTVLTVRHKQCRSHWGKGWEPFTDEVIRLVNEKTDPVVFILWGADAKKKIPLITNKRHLILTATHPSPRSAFNGFFGSRPFSQTNAFLESRGRGPIDWRIPD